MKIGSYIFALLLLFSVTANVSAGTANAATMAQGIALFYQKQYGGASAVFEKVEVANPGNHAAYLWHGLALAGNDDLDAAHNVWTIKMPWDTKAKSLTYFLRGLGHWRKGETQTAKYWFDQTQNYKQTPAYNLAKRATLDLLNGKTVPPIDQWPTIASLPGAKLTAARAASNTKPVAKAQPAKSAAKPAAPQKAAPVKAGVKPKGGLWKATITNGYKGQTLSFRVSADGKTISAITFQGYLICRGSRTTNTQLAPLRNVAIKGGSFSDTQLNGGAKVRFDFTGTFNSASSATGTYRVMSDTDCDTYKLIWKATRVG